MKSITVKILQLFLFIALVGTMLIPIFAHTQEYFTKIVDVDTGKYLDSDFKGRLYTLDGNGGNHQWWKMIALGNGVTTFKNYATYFRLKSDAEGNVSTFPGITGDFQKWKIEFNGIGQVHIKNIATGKYLDSNERGRTFTVDEYINEQPRWALIFY